MPYGPSTYARTCCESLWRWWSRRRVTPGVSGTSVTGPTVVRADQKHRLARVLGWNVGKGEWVLFVRPAPDCRHGEETERSAGRTMRGVTHAC